MPYYGSVEMLGGSVFYFEKVVSILFIQKLIASVTHNNHTFVDNFPFKLLLLNHAIHSRIRLHCEYFCTVADPEASVETIQSGTESGAQTGRR